MKITIHENSSLPDTEISITCPKITAEIEQLVSAFALIDATITGKKNEEFHFIPLQQIYYFEAVENKVVFYTKDESYETNIRLYELEERLSNAPFARVSKSAIVNLKKISAIRPDQNSRLMATLLSGDKVLVSRSFVSEIKKKLGV